MHKMPQMDSTGLCCRHEYCCFSSWKLQVRLANTAKGGCIVKGGMKKNAFITLFNAKISFNTLRTKVNSINMLHPMACLHNLFSATPENCFSAAQMKVKLNVTF